MVDTVFNDEDSMATTSAVEYVIACSALKGRHMLMPYTPYWGLGCANLQVESGL